MLFLVRQTRAALETATLQYDATRLSSHPLHKTMLTGALAFFWLIGSFWHVLILPYRYA